MTSIGFNVGANLGVNIAGPLDVLVDVRFFRGGDIMPRIKLTRFVKPTEIEGDLTVDTLADRMAPVRASFNPSFARMFFGVRIGRRRAARTAFYFVKGPAATFSTSRQTRSRFPPQIFLICGSV